MFKISSIGEKEFLGLREEWETLLKETEDLDLFSTWEWNYCWWKNFKKEKKLFFLTFRDNQNELVGIFPGCIVSYAYLGILKIRVLQFIDRGIERQKSIGEYGDFLDVIAHKGHRIKIYEELLEYLETIRDYDIIYLNGMKATSPFFLHLKNNDRNHLKISRFEQGSRVHFQSFPDNMDDYLKVMSRKFRSSIRRYVRNWKMNNGGTLQIVQDNESMLDFYDNFFNIVRERHHKNVSVERRTFFQEVANYSIEKNRFLGVYIKMNNEFAAVAANYVFNNKGYGYQHAINPQFAKNGPGTVLVYHLMEKLIENRIERFEFLQAKDYIKKWGMEYRYLNNIFIGAGTIRSWLFFKIYSSVETMKILIKRIIRRGESN